MHLYFEIFPSIYVARQQARHGRGGNEVEERPEPKKCDNISGVVFGSAELRTMIKDV